MAKSNRIESMHKKGTLYMQEGRFREAERVFRKAAMMNPNPTSLNNWAECRFHMDDYEGAMIILKPNLESDTIQPFAHALAAQALLALERKDQAEAELSQAVDDYEKGMKAQLKFGAVDAGSWADDAVFIKAIAGALGRHQTVLALHQRWEQYHNSPHDCFLAGVAAFNLGMFVEAMAYWAGLPWPDWAIMNAYCDVALAIEQGIIPAFPLGYNIPQLPGEIECKTKEDYVKTLCQGSIRMVILGIILDPNVDNMLLEAAMTELELLIRVSGEWGVSLARSLICAPGSRVSAEVKLVAAYALFVLGYIKEEGPSDVIGALVKAWNTLTVRADSKPKGSPDTFNPLRLYTELLKSEEGRAYLEQIDLSVLESSYEGIFRAIQRHMVANEDSNPDNGSIPEYSGSQAEAKREKEENKPVSTDVKLTQALRRMPVGWLNAACMAHGLDPYAMHNRMERAEELVSLLLDPDKLGMSIEDLDSEEKEVLKFLLNRDGWARFSVVEERFESMDGDGFYWEDAPPGSVVGRLCSKALVAVGRAKIDKRQYKVIVIPRELRSIMKGFLS
ncbi:MAG TPA: hypothetical protein GX530_08210 [Corynebacteriales bacterium]|nr:hypothetical protein [Mycobacteriales bacterium]